MSRVVRRFLTVIGFIFGAGILGCAAIGLFFDLNHYKPQIEDAVLKSTGMQLKIAGKASLAFFPHLSIKLRKVKLSNQGATLLDVDELRLSPRLSNLVFRHQLVIDQMSLASPKVFIEENKTGRMNYTQSLANTISLTNPSNREQKESLKIHEINIHNGTLTYLDRKADRKIELEGIHMNIKKVEFSPPFGNVDEFAKALSFQGDFEASSLVMGNMIVSDLKSELRGDHGFFDFPKMRAQLFGGTNEGELKVDLRGGVPAFDLTQGISRIDLAQLLGNRPVTVSGHVDGTAHLTASGDNLPSIIKSTNGEVSIHGKNIEVVGVDIDSLASNLKTAQSLDLVQIGAGLASAPIVPDQTQAAGIAGAASPTKSTLHEFISDWKITSGVAQTKDVAFATSKTTIAFSGQLDLTDKKYRNFYLATIDAQGCSKNKLKVVGPLDRPRPGAESFGGQISKSYLGQAGSAIGSMGSDIAGLFGGSHSKLTAQSGKSESAGCDHFYSGQAIRAG